MIVWFNLGAPCHDGLISTVANHEVVHLPAMDSMPAGLPINDVLVFLYHCNNQCQVNWQQISLLQSELPLVPVILTAFQLCHDNILRALRRRIVDYVVLPDDEARLSQELLNMSQGQQGAQAMAGIQSAMDGFSMTTAPAVEYIRHNLKHNMSVAQLAEQCGLEVNRFSRMFKQEQQLNVRQFIKKTRIQHACGMLNSKRMRIKDVAVSVGYDDPSYFVRQFRDVVGLTPAAYRYRQQKLFIASQTDG